MSTSPALSAKSEDSNGRRSSKGSPTDAGSETGNSVEKSPSIDEMRKFMLEMKESFSKEISDLKEYKENFAAEFMSAAQQRYEDPAPKRLRDPQDEEYDRPIRRSSFIPVAPAIDLPHHARAVRTSNVTDRNSYHPHTPPSHIKLELCFFGEVGPPRFCNEEDAGLSNVKVHLESFSKKTNHIV